MPLNISGMGGKATDMIFNFGQTVIGGTRRFIVWLLIIAVVGIIIHMIIKAIRKRKQHMNTTHDQEMLINAGKLACKRKRLRYLFISDNNEKLVNMGKIIGFNAISEKIDNPKYKPGNRQNKLIDQEFHIFIIKDGFKDLKFYKVLGRDYGDLFGDITLKHWNFKLDPAKRYLVPNTEHIPEILIKKMEEDEERGVNSLSALKPTIHQAIQMNPLHRIQIRIRALMSPPDDVYDQRKK